MTKFLRWCAVAASLAAVLSAGSAGCRRSAAQHFGAPFTDAPQVSIAQLLEAPESFQRQVVRVQGTIERQCPAAGCWLFLRDQAGRTLRVELGDYFARLPQHVGDTAMVEGELIAKGNTYEFIGSRISFGRRERHP